jgi:hypothetical protein
MQALVPGPGWFHWHCCGLRAAGLLAAALVVDPVPMSPISQVRHPWARPWAPMTVLHGGSSCPVLDKSAALRINPPGSVAQCSEWRQVAWRASFIPGASVHQVARKGSAMQHGRWCPRCWKQRTATPEHQARCYVGVLGLSVTWQPAWCPASALAECGGAQRRNFLYAPFDLQWAWRGAAGSLVCLYLPGCGKPFQCSGRVAMVHFVQRRPNSRGTRVHTQLAGEVWPVW